MLFGIAPAFADEFYFSRTRAITDAQSGATGLFLWNDATNAQTQIGGDGVHLRHATDGAMYVDGIATSLTGALYGFTVDDTADATFLPFTNQGVCSTGMRSRLVSINTTTGVFTYVGNWLSGRRISGAAFDGLGRLWAIDCVSGDVVQISPTTGQVVGGSISLGASFPYVSDLDFAANGMGIIGYGEMQFLVFDPSAGWVANVPISAQNSGFDSGLPNPYAVVGTGFTHNLAARNGSQQADACRLNIVENRGTDELGHANDPFFANPVIVRKEADQYNPSNLSAGWYNGGPGDMARAGGPALPSCFYDWGDAPASYGTLRTNNGARQAIIAGGPYLGAGLPDFELDGQPNATASGDDAAGTDDEDGVSIPVLGAGTTVQITVTAGNVGTGTRLQGWIDWARDGSFAQPGDQILVDAVVVAGTNTFDIAVPATATVGTTYARFRIANQTGLGILGLADSGEVEDYAIQIVAPNADLAITKDDGSATYTPGNNVIYTIVVSNNGPSAVQGAAVTDPLPTGISSATWTCGNATNGGVCGAAGGNGAINTTADLPAGASVTYTLTLFVPSTFSGNLVNTATVALPAGAIDPDTTNNSASDTDSQFPLPPPNVANLSCSSDASLLNTAYDGSGGKLTSGNDTHWQVALTTTPVTGTPPAGLSYNNAAVVTNPPAIYMVSPYDNANWISHAADAIHPTNVNYDIFYRYQANLLPGVNPGALTPRLDFYSDNSVIEIWVNGVAQGIQSNYGANDPYFYAGFTAANPAEGTLNGPWQSGLNEIVVHIKSGPGAQAFLAQVVLPQSICEPATVTLNKTTRLIAGGPFGFGLSNTVQATGSVSTTAVDVPMQVDGDSSSAGTAEPFAVTAFGTDVVITENALPNGWLLSDAICTSGGTPVGSRSGSAYVIPGSLIDASAESFECTFTNTPTTNMSIDKTVNPTAARAGDTVTYIIAVDNDGPGPGDGAIVADPPVPGVNCTAATLSCSASGGAACPASLDVASFQSTGLTIPTFPAGGSLQFGMACTVTATGQ